MSRFARLAIGTIQDDADPTPISWALMDALEQAGLAVQCFQSHAYFSPVEGATAITGSSPRHLDSWLMDEQACRDVLVRGTRSSDLALVEGRFSAVDASHGVPASRLETLCDWLDLPRLAIVDVRRLSTCRLPNRPATLDGLILDGVANEAELIRLETLFDAIWNLPVVAWLGKVEKLREQVHSLDAGRRPTLELCHALGAQLACHADLESIFRLATDREPLMDEGGACRQARFQSRPLRVAIACDQAFGGYFPDTLDLLELGGATLLDFSPLADDRLPADCDLVYFGCGHPELFAEQLSKNDCMMLALKNHLCSGKRMYAECGGLAYLCQHLELPDGSRWPMVGAVPATARFDPVPGLPQPAEITLASDTWLARAGETWRGYLNPHYSLAPHGAVLTCARDVGRELDAVKRHQAVGSRLHLNFSARGDLIERFFSPCPARCDSQTVAVSRMV